MKAARTTKIKAGKRMPAAAGHKQSGKHPHMGVVLAIGPVPHGTNEDMEHGAHVEGGKARRRLDRPSRKAFAGGGSVKGPSPSLRQASMGVDLAHPAFHQSAHGMADAPDVAMAKRALHSPEASRLSNEDIKAVGDYIMRRQAEHRATGGRAMDDRLEDGAGSGVGHIKKSEHAARKFRR